MGGGNEILEEGELNDVLLDEHILHTDSQYDEEQEQVALEAHHSNSLQNNLYKFKNQDLAISERPKTSGNVYRQSSLKNEQENLMDHRSSSRTGTSHKQRTPS